MGCVISFDKYFMYYQQRRRVATLKGPFRVHATADSTAHTEVVGSSHAMSLKGWITLFYDIKGQDE